MTPDFDIVWKKSAAKELRGLDQTVRAGVMSAIANLENDPFPHGVRKLQGTTHTFRREGSKGWSQTPAGTRNAITRNVARNAPAPRYFRPTGVIDRTSLVGTGNDLPGR